jgi:hypothetical protein
LDALVPHVAQRLQVVVGAGGGAELDGAPVARIGVPLQRAALDQRVHRVAGVGLAHLGLVGEERDAASM